MKNRRYLDIVIITLTLYIALTSCQRATTKTSPSFDEWLKTPIPEATLWAYKVNTPVTNKMQAVIAARANLLETRIRPINHPRVISVEFTRYEDAIIRMQAKESGQYSSDEKVWLINFEGDFIFYKLPPEDRESFFGNVFVMLLPDEGIIVTWKKIEPSNPYPINTPIAYPVPESSSLITKPVPTLDQMLIMTLSPEQIATQMQPYKAHLATEVQGFKERADITLDSIGQTFTFTVQSRFFVFLDDYKYPLSQLKCEPEWVIGFISNGSFRGPDRYPIYFEGRKIGKCILRNGDFSVNIVIVQRTPVLPLQIPLPTNTLSYP